MLRKLLGVPFRLSDDVRRTLEEARSEAVRRRHGRVGPDHLLIALTRDPGVAEMLERLEAAPEQVRAAVEARMPPGRESVPPRKLEHSPRARRGLEGALAEVRESGAPAVRSHHLLIGLLRDEDGLACKVLSELGITLEGVRAAGAEDRLPEERPFPVRIDDASDRSIYEQIVAQVTEAAATGELRPGERLPTVRRLADRLDVAPGTVARAYGELERQGVVVTEGARGTRIASRPAAAQADEERAETLAGLLRPAAVAAFHLGANADDLRAALESAMRGIFDRDGKAA